MNEIIVANQAEHAAQIRELFWEYLQWANETLKEAYGVNFDIAALLETDMQGLGKFMPPTGRLLLSYSEEHLTGIACLKYLAPRMGEIKRMYVRPSYRRNGIGRALLDRLFAEAIQSGYESLRLDSPRCFSAAHRLYHAFGFREIEAYEGSEIPKEIQQHWVFMEAWLKVAGSR